MALAGTLEIEMRANMARFSEDMRKVQSTVGGAMSSVEKSVASAKRALGALGIGLGIGYFASLIKSTVNAVAALDDLAETTGASVGELSKLSQQARISGVDMATVEMALVRLGKSMHGTKEESEKATRALDALGLKAADLKNMDTAKQLQIVAVAMNKFGDSSGKTALAMDLLGKSGAKVLPFLKDMATDGELAATVTAEQAAKAEELEKAIRRLANEFSNFKQAVMVDAIPALLEWVEANSKAVEIAGSVGEMLRLFVFNLDAMTTEKPGEQIRRLTNEIAELGAEMQKPWWKQGARSVLLGEQDVKDRQKQVEFLKYLQAQAALKGRTGQQFLDARDLALQQKLTLNYVAVDEAAMKKAAAERKKLLDLGTKGEIDALIEREKAWTDEQKAINDLKNAGYDADKKLLDLGVKGQEEAALARAASVMDEMNAINDARNAGFEAEKRRQEEQLREQKRMADEVDRMLGDAIMRGLERGEGFAETFWQTMINMAKTVVLRPTISAVMSPFTNAVGSAFGDTDNGLSLLSSGSNLIGSGAGLLGSAGAYSTITGGSAAAGSQAALLAAQTGEFGAAGLASTAGASSAMTTLAAAAPYIAAAIAAYYLLTSDDPDAMRKGNWVGGIGQAGRSTQNQWFDASTGAGPFAGELAAAEQQIMGTLELSAAQLASINVALEAQSGREFGFGMEHTDWTQSGAPQAIAAARMQAIADGLGMSVEALTEKLAAAQKVIDLAPAKLQLEIELMELQGKTVEALAAERKRELDALDPALRALQQEIYAQQDLATAANDAGDALGALANQLSITQSAVEQQISASRSASQAARQIAESYRSITQALADAMVQIRGGGTAGAGGRLDALFGVAMTGNTAALSGLPQAGQDFIAASLATSRTSLDFARAQAKVVNMLDQAQTVSLGLVNVNEYMATLYELQTGVLESIRDQLALPSPDAAILTEQKNLLASIGVLLKDQTGVMLSGNATQDVIREINALGTSYSELQLAALVVSGGVQSDSLTALVTGNAMTVSLLQQLVGMQGAAAMAAYDAKFQEAVGTIWAGVQAAGGTLGDFDQQFAAWKAANPMPSYAVGTNYVPSTGPAMLHQGERVMTSAANDALVSEIHALRSELGVALSAMRRDTQKTASTLEAVANGQLSFSTEAAA